MATPPSGYPYGSGQESGPQGETHNNRFNFPSAPSRRPQRLQPPQQQRPQQQQPRPYDSQPYEPSVYDQPQAPRIQPVQPQRRAPEPAPTGGMNNPLVRPYAMTGGRTRPRYQLAIEALVSTTADPSKLQGQLPEHQRICHLCREIKSVAEISALLSIPLGVARILVADLAEAGLVAIHQPGGDETAGGQPDVTLLERVLSGLRKL
ncbi:DUF742 domain-containing protein [Streptomyces inhibens]|uniref:DUF742 domain-containing protein n=1 Tax=Streptomyces inhibens TaxID=2293571 RepID=UPI00402ABE9C